MLTAIAVVFFLAYRFSPGFIATGKRREPQNGIGERFTISISGCGAGFLRAPMTSVFMVLEVSGNYSIIVPVIIANRFAYVISRGLQPVPIFDVLTRQDGLDLPSMEELREEDTLQVEDAMQQVKEPVLDADGTVNKAIQQAEQSTSDYLLVRVKPAGWSAVSKQDLQTMAKEGKAEFSLRSALPIRQIPFLHPILRWKQRCVICINGCSFL